MFDIAAEQIEPFVGVTPSGSCRFWYTIVSLFVKTIVQSPGLTKQAGRAALDSALLGVLGTFGRGLKARTAGENGVLATDRVLAANLGFGVVNLTDPTVL